MTIIGGSTNPPSGASGIEFFDWCVKDEGKSVRLAITNLRCFRARTAGIDINSKKASITGVLVDRAVGTATTTAELPGGVGIRTRGDQTLIKDSNVRQVGAIGIWVGGTDANGNGRVASIEGDKASCSTTTGSKMLIEKGAVAAGNVSRPSDCSSTAGPTSSRTSVSKAFTTTARTRPSRATTEWWSA